MEIKNIRNDLNSRVDYRGDELNRMVEQINRSSSMLQKHTRLSLDSSIGRVIIKVVDTETDTVIKEVPPAELQKMYRTIREGLDSSNLPTHNLDV